MKQLTAEQIEELRNFDTPTICNAIESFRVRGRTEGFTNPSLKMRVACSDGKPMVGYAVTAKVSACYPAKPEHDEVMRRYYAKFSSFPGPKIAAIQDIDLEPVGSFWGDVQATIHKSLGAVGVVTSGGVRDISEVQKVGFAMSSKRLLISHAYIHMESCDDTVEICGMTVHPGDLIHADMHGAIVIPAELVSDLARACLKAQAAENAMLDPCKKAIAEGRVPTADELIEWRHEMLRLRSL